MYQRQRASLWLELLPARARASNVICQGSATRPPFDQCASVAVVPNRLNAQQHLVKGTSWRAMFLSSANKSIREMLVNGAEADHVAVLNRLTEVQLPRIDPDDRQWISEMPITLQVARNYGHAGIIHAQWLVANQDRLPLLIQQKCDELMRPTDAARGERLWFANLAAMFVGAELARAANLHAINVQRWVLDTLLPDQRRAVRSSHPSRTTYSSDGSSGGASVKLMYCLRSGWPSATRASTPAPNRRANSSSSLNLKSSSKTGISDSPLSAPAIFARSAVCRINR
ncbi:hypothetical protein [Paraburkholderia strydomiana]|uniref:hypothetical protein n=1 Tax=Paraburkholderia strydomiana TaxID=1245417 RepID=UPI0038B8089A